MPLLDRADPADAGTDVRPAAVGGEKPGRDLRVADRELGRGDGVPDEGVHLPGLLPVHELERVEAADLRRDAGRIARRVELGQRADAALPGEKSVPGCPGPHAHGGHKADPRDDDASFVVSLRFSRIT